MHSNRYTVFFMIVITVILGSFLSVANSTLKNRQKQNIENDSKKNILTSLGYKQNLDKPWTDEDIKTIFEKNIDAYVLDIDGVRTDLDPKIINSETDIEYFPIYVDTKNSVPQGYAIPISGKGLWSTLYGFFALEPDGITVKGITFYAHKETPGLGGEVDKPWFQKNFIGKKIINDNGELISIKVVKGKANPESPYEVDGISGATITSKGLENFLADDLKKYEKFFKNIRKG